MSQLVSICIPTCNRPALAIEAVRSCLDQTYRDIEIIVCDDSRDERTQRAVASSSTDPRLRYYRNPQRLRQAANVNRLFGLARGERLVLLHDDDVLLPDAVEILDRCWQENSNLIACYGKHHIIAHSGALLPEMTAGADEGCSRTQAFEGVQARSMEAVLSGQFPPDGFMISTVAARATLFRSEDETGAECDLDFRIRLAALPGHFYFVNRYLSQYRMTDRSVASNATDIDYGFTMVRDLDLAPELEDARKRFLRARAPVAVRRYLVFGHRREALQILRNRDYWPHGRLSAGQVVNALLFVLPTPLISVLRAGKHAARAALRRNPSLYAPLYRARSALLRRVRPSRVQR